MIRSLRFVVAPLRAVLVLSVFVATVVRAQGAPAPATSPADHVVLVSIDGLRPELYLDASWPAPTLQRLAREGVRAEGMRGVFPTVTYPSHTTLVTGAFPARHGVLYNTLFEPGGPGRWYWHYDSVRVASLWTAVKDAGRQTAAVSWPVTVGAPITWNVPEYWSLARGADPVTPVREVATPGLLDEIEREATGRMTARNYTLDDLTRDDRLAAMAAWLLETKRPALVAVHFAGVDHFQHEVGREGPEVQRAVAAVDNGVRAIVEAAARAGILDRTTFVIVGDHGFVSTNVRVNPNVWLAQAGLRDTSASGGDWRATFHVSGGSVALRTRRPNDADAVRRARAAVEAQPATVRGLFRFVERDELTRLGADPDAAFALSGMLGTAFGGNASGPAITDASGGTHGYVPTDFPEILTGFVASGAGVRQGVTLHRMRQEDVAPTIAELLGVPFRAADGMAARGVLGPRGR
jgi:predicted AlkP superfamily pyrophosphatase or phosphodiesterase